MKTFKEFLNEGRLRPDTSDLKKEYPNAAKLINNLNNSSIEKWLKLYDKYISGDLKPELIQEFFEEGEYVYKMITKEYKPKK